MKEIKTLSEINFAEPEIISFLATVLNVDNAGDSEKKKPFKATLKLEESGENIQVCSWKFTELDKYKELALTDDVYRFEARPSVYNNVNQLRVGDIFNINMKSTKKILKAVNSDAIKRELSTIVDTYIPNNGNNSIYREIIKNLVFANEKFWSWPAATRMHHAYPGGLAKHTLNVTKTAIAIWKTYEGSNMNIAAIVAGAVLHDVGKVMEYNADGSRTVYGNLIPHAVIGYEKICLEALKLGLDPEKDPSIIMLGHIVLTHHGKVEFGACTKPNILEAIVVSRADDNDAVIESCDKHLDETELNNQTENIQNVDLRLFKWHN